jgi:hypothetical protein
MSVPKALEVIIISAGTLIELFSCTRPSLCDRDSWLLAEHLPKMDVLGSIDPFIQFNLSSDARQRLTHYGPTLQTSIKKNAPYRADWNESFLFGIDEPVPLKLELMDWDRTGTEKVGEAIASIDEVFKLMQSRIGSETMLNLPFLNDNKQVFGRDNVPCILNAKLRILQDEKKIHAGTQEELNDSQVV